MCALIARLVYLQIYQHKRYTTLSNKNQLSLVPIAPNRGLIYDRNGVLLAENIPAFSLAITPDRVKNVKQLLIELSELFPEISEQDRNLFYKQYKQHRRFEPIPLLVKLTHEQVARFSTNQYRFPGVIVQAHLIRRYPLGDLMAHVLGYVGRINQQELHRVDAINYSATNYIGKLGIEKFYEDLLHGKVGHQQIETDASGHVVRVLKRTQPIPGKNLYLTIDSQLQKTALEAFGGNRGALVAIEPETGEVLALVSSPTYDPNLFINGIDADTFAQLQNSPKQPLYNRAVRGQYPPASTIKPFYALQGLNTYAVTQYTRIYDPGWFKLKNSAHIYRDWLRTGHGWINLSRAIIVSCDTYFYELARRLGINLMNDILAQFGFGTKTHIDIAEEVPGVLPNPEWKMRYRHHRWYKGDTIITGIGQGFMLATPLQLAMATATLAERGQRFRPHVVKQIESADGTINKVLPYLESPVNIQNPEAWDIVLHAMRGVITKRYGTGYRFGQHPPYSVAGKTGTAQVVSNIHHDPQTQRSIPVHLRDHSLFIAFAPYHHPKIAVATIVEHNTEGYAVTVTRKVIDAYLLNAAKHNITHFHGDVHNNNNATESH
ncbi:MAG: penicillin-binding protein 2 [Gammaproteobacteria bacterium]